MNVDDDRDALARLFWGVFVTSGDKLGLAPAGAEPMSIPTALTGALAILLRRTAKEAREALLRVEAGTTTIQAEMAELDSLEAAVDRIVREHGDLPLWLK